MKQQRILIAGCGYVGQESARQLAEHGHEVWVVKRTDASVEGAHSVVLADLTSPGSLDASLPHRFDAVVYTAAADRRTEPCYREAYVDGLRHAVEFAERHGVPRLIFTSSTAVYAQREGQVVDETSATNPTHFSGQIMLEAEALLAGSAVHTTALRLGGIYGPGRERLIRMVREQKAELRPRSPYSNRIHRDDCAGAIAHVLALPSPAPCYIAVDHAQAAISEVYGWLGEHMEVPVRRVDEVLALHPDRSNKRCSSAHLRASGYQFKYPTFREGYAAILASGPP